MRRLARLLVGYRDDLALDRYSWHRPLKIASILVFIALGLVAAFLSRAERQRRPLLADVEILANMNDLMMKNHAARRKEYGADFLKLEGDEGVRRGDHVEPVHVTESSCDVIELVDNEGILYDPPKPTPLCTAIDARVEDIVKWRYTTLGSIRVWMASATTGTLWALVAAVLLLNVYYRGIAYLVCGPDKRGAG